MRDHRCPTRHIPATAAVAVVTAIMFLGPASAANFTDPVVFASQNGVLDIMMVARAKPISTLTFQPPGHAAAIHPTGWVYEVCKRPPSGLACPSGTGTVTGGKWYFTVSGQQFPTVPITAADGEIWRIASAAGSLSYDLQLVNDANQQPIVVQLIAIDGVAVHLPQDTPMGSMVRMGGGKFRVVPCPAAQAIGNSVPVCVNEVVMMPSSRVEMWVTYRDQNGRVVNPPRGASATLKNTPLTMGSGDTWPAVDLAKVQFNQTTQRQFTSNQVVVNDSGALQPGGILVAVIPGATASPLPAGCAALPAGHRRMMAKIQVVPSPN